MEYSSSHFKNIIKTKGISQLKLAEILKIDKRTVCLKVNGKKEWLLSEMITICNYIDIESLDAVFTKRKERDI